MTNFFSKTGLSSGQDKRRAAFAGSWYEADPSKLRAQLTRFLEQAEKTLKATPMEPSFQTNAKIQGSVLAIVSPHAGYLFSGQTAAFGYDAAAEDRKVKRVFLLGPSHYAGFHGAALPVEKDFATPLGDLKVDRQVIDDLACYPGFEFKPEVHRHEHSLEMQLPFIREAFGDVRVVPIIVGLMGDLSELNLAAQILRRYIEPDDLVIVSSDFTHYGPRYDYEPYPGPVRENVRKLDEEAFSYLHKADLPGFFEFRERTQDTICGFFPCALLLAMLPDGSHATLLNYRTSQDCLSEDDTNSVSYMAIAFSNPTAKIGWPADEPTNVVLTDKDKESLLKVARQALETFVREGRQISPSDVSELVSPVTEKSMGAFVTLYKRNIGRSTVHGDDRDLRGCVGYIFPVKPLVQAVIDNAIGSASRDYRFKNVTEEELADLQIDINVLTPPRRVKSYKEIVIGRDGILLYKQGRQAVFLPSVATEFGWSLEQTLAQLAIKAGCAADAWKHDAQFDVFQSISFEEH
jgi:AmmeMemoRadiSam system protein B/AmmeMemoRadiSam system protein A